MDISFKLGKNINTRCDIEQLIYNRSVLRIPQPNKIGIIKLSTISGVDVLRHRRFQVKKPIDGIQQRHYYCHRLASSQEIFFPVPWEPYCILA